jgi:hypothetical protein
VHWAHDVEAARFSRLGSSSVVKGLRDRRKRDREDGGDVGGGDTGLEPGGVESLGPRRTMVLLAKQVHLQNVGTAV